MRLEAFSLLIQSNALASFKFGACWLSIWSQQSKNMRVLSLPNREEMTVIMVMDQIGCSETDMVQAFGEKSVILKIFSIIREVDLG